MKIPKRKYSISSFYRYLEDIHGKFSVKNPLRILNFITNFNSWDELYHEIFAEHPQLISHENLGEITLLKFRYFDPKLEKYVPVSIYSYFSPETKLLICFTDEKRGGIDATINKIVSEKRNIYYLWVSPILFDKIQQEIFKKFSDTLITEFYAKRFEWSKKESVIRPGVGRNISYTGDDGREALNEMKRYYGVVPSNIQFLIPDEDLLFRISNKGSLSLESFRDMELPLEILKFLLESFLKSKRIVETSKIDFVSIKTERKEFKIAKPVPWIISFEKSLGYNDYDTFLGKLKKDFKFTPFNLHMEEGSVFLSATVLDETKKSLFSIRGNENEVRILPFDEVSFDTFLRFYEAFIDIDPNAKAEEFHYEVRGSKGKSER